MNKIELTIEQDFLNNTRKIVANAEMPENVLLKVLDMRESVKATFDRRQSRKIASDNKPVCKNCKIGQSHRSNRSNG